MSSSEVRTARVTRALTRRMTTEPPPAPLVLDRYRLSRRLGTGAFGTVWMARDERLDRDVAVKILARDRIQGGRFEREARAAARLSHPAIVTLYEAAVDDEGAYLVSELVRGSTLDALLREGALSDRDVVDIAIALCDALAHAHAQGIVHRDVKPSNVLVPDAPASTAQVAKLTDFGVARVVGGDALTMTGDVLGTLAYMAPEQAEGLEAGDGADLYSLALVTYEALSGVNPVAGGALTPSSRRLGAHLPPLRRQRRDLPRMLGQSIDFALRPRPRERGTITDLRAGLVAVRDQVGDEPGVVANAWSPLRPFSTFESGGWNPSTGGETAATRAASLTRLWRRDPDDAAGAAPSTGLHQSRGAGPRPAEALATPSRPPWPDRALGAVAAAGLTAWLTGTALTSAPVAPAPAGLLAALAVVLLPRLGWAAVTVLLSGVAASQHDAGAALVVLVALMLPVLVLPGRPSLWPVSAGAPALGLLGLGLAGAWPALAARAATPWRRAALGAVGWVWLLLASAVVGRTLYLPRPPGTPVPAAWLGSLAPTAHGLLATLGSSGVLAPAILWGAAAAVLPWLVRGRSPALDVVRVVVWASILASGTGVAIAAVHGSNPAGNPPRAALGAVVAAGIALMPLAATMWREALHSGRSPARVP